jgi:hypothetical protein
MLLALIACDGAGAGGPEPYKPQHYALTAIDERALPQRYIKQMDHRIIGGLLAPYAVGRTIDQRLVNDRGGRGSTGGNSRDTTVLRGQFLDIRTLEHESAPGVFVRFSDSLIVDAVIVDTTLILTRPHPDPSRTTVDTGYFSGGFLILSTEIDSDRFGIYFRPLERKVFKYRVSR